MLNIVLINYNTSKETEDCINSIFSCIIVKKIHIIIIDNNSCNIDKNLLGEIYQKHIKTNRNIEITLHFNKENIGFARANNIALQYVAFNDVIWFLNNDTLVNQPLIDCIFSQTIEDKIVYHCDILDFNGVYESDGLHYINLLTGHSSLTKHNNNYVPYICGASVLIKYSESMPKWNEDYFLYYEDADISLTFEANGYQFYHLENCHIKHKGNASSSQRGSSINLIKLRSQVLFIRKHGQNFFLYVLCKILYLLILRRFVELREFLKII